MVYKIYLNSDHLISIKLNIMDRINSTYPILDIGGIIVWDLTEFDKASKVELLNNDAISQPTKKNDDYVTLCKCDFNVKLLIYEKATVDDVATGWTKFNKELELSRLVNLFLKDSLNNIYLTRQLHEEPDILLLLRLVYWYYKSSLVGESFKFKRTEIKEQLIRGLLNEREKIEKQIHAVEDNTLQMDALASQLGSVILDFIKSPLNPDLKQKSEGYRIAWFKVVWNFTSELLFAAHSFESGFNVTFQTRPKEEGHDYDFIVEGYPVQMKSLNTPYDFQSIAKVKQSRKKFVDEGKITNDLVIKMILNAIRKKLGEIDDALKKKAKIMFINGTSDECGQYFGQLYLEVDNPFTFKHSLTTAIQLAKEENSFIPLIFCATGTRLKYYINTLPFRVPIITVNGQKEVDRTKEIEVMYL